MIVVHVPGAFTLPNEESIICTNWLGLDEAHVNENHNAFPDDLPVDSTTVAFKLNLIDNCLRNVLFSVIKDSFPKHAMTPLADQLHLIGLHVIPVEVLKASIHHLRVDAVAVPSPEIIVQKFFSPFVFYQRSYLSLQVLLHELFKDLIDILLGIFDVDMVNNDIVHFHVLLFRGSARCFSAQKLQQLLHIVLVDKVFAVLQSYTVRHNLKFLLQGRFYFDLSNFL